MKNTIKDFDLDLKTTKNNSDEPLVGSRYLCTPGSCWKLIVLQQLLNNLINIITVVLDNPICL